MVVLEDQEVKEIKDDLKEMNKAMNQLITWKNVSEERDRNFVGSIDQMSGKLDTLSGCISSLKTDIAKGYVTKGDCDKFSAVCQEALKKSIEVIHTRIDKRDDKADRDKIEARRVEVEKEKAQSLESSFKKFTEVNPFLFEIIKVLVAAIVVLAGGKLIGLF